MKKIIFLSGLISCLNLLHAQNNGENISGNIKSTGKLLKALSESPNFDSLKRRAAADTENETRAITLFAISAQYLNNNIDSSLKYIRLFNEVPSKSIIWEANGLVIIGDIYLRLGNSSLALENLLKGTNMQEKLKDSAGMGMAYWNLGKLYRSIDDTTKAIAYYLKSINIAAHANEKVPWSFSMGHLGDLYLELNRIDSALYYTEAAHEARSADRSGYGPILLSQLGNIHQKKGNKALAMQYYRIAMEQASASRNLAAASDACIGMAILFKKENKFDSSYYYSREGFNLAQQLKNPGLIWKASLFLKELFKEKNILDSAFSYQEIMIAANDSIHNLEKINKVHVISFAEQQRIGEEAAQKRDFQNKIRQLILVGSLAVFVVIGVLLFRNNRQKQKAYSLLKGQKEETDRQKLRTEETLTELRATQAQLIQSEKMASLGELTAGIAHEIQNPLNFVNNFSEVSSELINEMVGEVEKGNTMEIKSIAEDVKQNIEKIIHHGKRADAIVKGMLQHSQSSTGSKTPTDINALCDEYLRLSYHGFRGKEKTFKARLETNFDNTAGLINLVPQDIGRVILNLLNNAFYVVNEKQKKEPGTYQPAITVTTKKVGDKIEISVKDNGDGIPQKILDKIFQPFFTTKPAGQGTGLGLSLSYDIVNAHGGEIKVKSSENEGSEFTVHLPAV